MAIKSDFKTMTVEKKEAAITIPFNAHICDIDVCGRISGVLLLKVPYIYDTEEERTEIKRFKVFRNGDEIDLPGINLKKTMHYGGSIYHIFSNDEQA
jgi:hypothetical protein